MNDVLSIFTAVHVLFYLLLALRWSNLKSPTFSTNKCAFSVIVPARNEAKHIKSILNDLVSQDFPSDQFEIIVVDDFSEDGTPEVVRDVMKESSHTIRLFQPEDESSGGGKKEALTKGIDQAVHEIILTTDADCRIGSRWLRTYRKYFNPDIQIVAGPVSLTGNGLFAKLQQIEFAGMMGYGATTIDMNNPCMCSGANLGFRKSAFKEVNGYRNNMFIPSGDDEFLLYDIMKRYPGSARFMKAEAGIVEATSHSTWLPFLNQRTRWISKWKHNKNPKLRLNAVVLFFDHLVFLLAFFQVVFSGSPGWFISMLMIRIFSKYIFLRYLNYFLKIKRIFCPFLLLEIIYPFYVLVMGLRSIFGTYTWKGRKY